MTESEGALRVSSSAASTRLSIVVDHIEGWKGSSTTCLELDLTSISDESLVARSKPFSSSGEGTKLSGWMFENSDSPTEEEPVWILNIETGKVNQTKVFGGYLEVRLLDEGNSSAIIASGRVPIWSLLHQSTIIEGPFELTLSNPPDNTAEGNEAEGEDTEDGGSPAVLTASVKIKVDDYLGNVEDFPDDWRMLTLHIEEMCNVPAALLNIAPFNDSQTLEQAACAVDGSHPLEYRATFNGLTLAGGKLYRWIHPDARDDSKLNANGEHQYDNSENITQWREACVTEDEFRMTMRNLGYGSRVQSLKALFESLSEGSSDGMTYATFERALAVPDSRQSLDNVIKVAGYIYKTYGTPLMAWKSIKGKDRETGITRVELANWLNSLNISQGSDEKGSSGQSNDIVEGVFEFMLVPDGGALSIEHLSRIEIYRRVAVFLKIEDLRRICIDRDRSIAQAYEAMAFETGVVLERFLKYFADDASTVELGEIFAWLDTDRDGIISACDWMVLDELDVIEALLEMRILARRISKKDETQNSLDLHYITSALKTGLDNVFIRKSGITGRHFINFLTFEQEDKIDSVMVKEMANLDIVKICRLDLSFRDWLFPRFGSVDNAFEHFAKSVTANDLGEVVAEAQRGPAIKWSPPSETSYKGRRFLEAVQSLYSSSIQESEDEWVYLEPYVPISATEVVDKKATKGAKNDTHVDLEGLAKGYRGKARICLADLAHSSSVEGTASVVTVEPQDIHAYGEADTSPMTFELAGTYIRYRLSVDRPISALDTTLLAPPTAEGHIVAEVIPRIVEQPPKVTLEDGFIDKIARCVTQYIVPGFAEDANSVNQQEAEMNVCAERLSVEVRNILIGIFQTCPFGPPSAATAEHGDLAGIASLFTYSMQLVNKAINAVQEHQTLIEDEELWNGQRSPSDNELSRQQELLSARYARLSFEAEANGWKDRAILFFEKRLALSMNDRDVWFEYATFLCRISSAYNTDQSRQSIAKLKAIGALQKCLALSGICGSLTEEPSNGLQQQGFHTEHFQGTFSRIKLQVIEMFIYSIGCVDRYFRLVNRHDVKKPTEKEVTSDEHEEAAARGREAHLRCMADLAMDEDGLPLDPETPPIPTADLITTNLIEDLANLGLGDGALSILSLVDAGCIPSAKFLKAANALDPYRARIWAELCVALLQSQDIVGSAMALQSFVKTSGITLEEPLEASQIEYMSNEVHSLRMLIKVTCALLSHGKLPKEAESIIHSYQRHGVAGVSESSEVQELLSRSLFQQGRRAGALEALGMVS
ncbi:hypothetical protein FOL47_010624 [Perkinsus chesapeaki]|uniref:Uncharacterized protein n=1 Tax=Perkinsus chesapeaki TaxID=330153 RepID=A0A7J6MP55_PERCH|nr:hypothetical protein FOL47_010624 [Perkinsus chesapeaki]